jgi:hypothetical protein
MKLYEVVVEKWSTYIVQAGSDDARRLEPVPWEVEAPKRVSVTLVKKADACPRDAGMYLRYRGGSQTGPLLRGSLFHLFAERAMAHLMMHGEQSLFAAQPGEDPVAAAEQVSQTTKEWVNELADETGWPVTRPISMTCGRWPTTSRSGWTSTRSTSWRSSGSSCWRRRTGRCRGRWTWRRCRRTGRWWSMTTSRRSTCRRMRTSRRWCRCRCTRCCCCGATRSRSPCGECEGAGKLADGSVQRPRVIEEVPPLGLEHVQWVRARQIYPRFLKTGRWRRVSGSSAGRICGMRWRRRSARCAGSSAGWRSGCGRRCRGRIARSARARRSARCRVSCAGSRGRSTMSSRRRRRWSGRSGSRRW